MADLRIWPHCLKKKHIERLAQYHRDAEFDMPDKYLSKFIEAGLIKQLLGDLENYARASVKKNLCRVLTYLSTQRDCRAYILRYNGHEKTMQMAQDRNQEIRFEALRLLQALY